MENAKEILFAGLLYALAITVGIVVAQIVHGFLNPPSTSSTSTPPV